MRFEQIRLTNWGPFRGDHRISLKITDGAPIVVIFGENGKGKTSLAKAARWCLYGSDSGVDCRSYANWFELRESESFRVEVTLEFSKPESVTGGQANTKRIKYELTRSFNAKSDKRRSTEVMVEDFRCTLKGEDGIFLDRVEKWIGLQLPREVAKFLIFDGEDLNQLRAELESGHVSTIVKEGIESVMGIPALKGLEELLQLERKKVDKNIKTSKEHQGSVDVYNLAVKNREQKEAELLDRQRILKQTELDRQKLLTELAKKQEFTDKIAQRKLLEDERAKSKSEEKLAQDEIKHLFEDDWWIPLTQWITKSTLREVKNRDQQRDREKRVTRLQSLESIGRDEQCPTCKQHVLLAEADIAEIADIRAWLSENQDSVEGDKGFMERFKSPEAERERARNLLRNERKAKIEVDQFDADLGRIKVLMAEVKEDEISALFPRWRNIERYVGELKEQIKRIEDPELPALRKIESEKRKALQKLGAVPVEQESYAMALEQIQSLVGNVRSVFRDRVRKEVATVASRHFVEMINNEDLVALEITEDFRIRSVNKHLSAPKEMMSAGQMLISVYAFVGALIDVSSVDGAWLLDTPMTRLDRTNMRSTWDWLCSRKRQVIILPHSGELTKEQSLEFLRGRASQRYEICNADKNDADSKFVEVIG